MAIRRIVSIGDPVLRQVSKPVARNQINSPEIKKLITDLIDTMRNANGAGIAAPQVGVALRVIVMEVIENPRYRYKPAIPLTIAINPTLTPLDDEMVIINEGCLSVPLRGELESFVNIRVTYTDENGALHDEVKRGLTAGTWQHEVHHLDGVLMVDRVKDSSTLSTWEEYDKFHKDAFVKRITEFVERVGS